jgi:hypothetical protein
MKMLKALKADTDALKDHWQIVVKEPEKEPEKPIIAAESMMTVDLNQHTEATHDNYGHENTPNYYDNHQTE